MLPLLEVMVAVVVDKIFSIFQKTGGCDSKDTTTDPVFDVEVVALDVVFIIKNYACAGVCVNQNQKLLLLLLLLLLLGALVVVVVVVIVVVAGGGDSLVSYTFMCTGSEDDTFNDRTWNLVP